MVVGAFVLVVLWVLHCRIHGPSNLEQALRHGEQFVCYLLGFGRSCNHLSCHFATPSIFVHKIRRTSVSADIANGKIDDNFSQSGPGHSFAPGGVGSCWLESHPRAVGSRVADNSVGNRIAESIIDKEVAEVVRSDQCRSKSV